MLGAILTLNGIWNLQRSKAGFTKYKKECAWDIDLR